MGLIGMCCCSSKAATTHQIRLLLLQIDTTDQVTGTKVLHLRSMVCGQPEDSKWRSRRGRGGWCEVGT
jgi:hypothetical protein